jgi:hypothetical protein
VCCAHICQRWITALVGKFSRRIGLVLRPSVDACVCTCPLTGDRSDILIRVGIKTYAAHGSVSDVDLGTVALGDAVGRIVWESNGAGYERQAQSGEHGRSMAAGSRHERAS